MPAQPQAKKDLAHPSHRDVLMEAPTAEGAMKVILIALALAGCADQWTKIGVTDQQADIDFYQCKRENAHFSDGSIVGPTGDFAQEEMVRQCIRARGYQAEMNRAPMWIVLWMVWGVEGPRRFKRCQYLVSARKIGL